MRTAGIVVALVSLAVVMTGCSGFYAAPVIPPQGMLYTDVAAPINTEGGEVPDRNGEAYCQSVLGLFAWGDASVKAAAEEGGLSTVDQVDYKFWNVLGIYSKFTTIAYGK